MWSIEDHIFSEIKIWKLRILPNKIDALPAAAISNNSDCEII